MKKITLFLFCLFSAFYFNAQTIAWSSDSEDVTGWSILDDDGDTNNWGYYSGGGEDLGFSPGAVFFSESWSSVPAPNGTALTPDNYLFTPTFSMPGTATSITYKMKVAANDVNYFAEKFSVYVYDNDDMLTPETLIYTETLTAGGDGSAKTITATIPVTFAGKTLGIIIRHYDCTDENQLLIDDFEVSYSTTLSISEQQLDIVGVYPNPVKDYVYIKTNDIIETISVTNQLGQRVLNIKKTGIVNNTIDVSSLSKGMYFLNVKVDNKSQSIKIIKE